MDDAEDSYLLESAPRPDRPPVAVVSPLTAYQTALGRYEGLTLYEIHKALGIADLGTKPRALPGVIAERLGEARTVERLLAELDKGPRLALTLFALTETTSWPLLGLAHALACLGVDPSASLRRLGELGLVAFEFPAGEPVTDPVKALVDGKAGGVNVLVHPSAPGAARTMQPDSGLPAIEATVRQIREADGLEAILRLGAVWQRVDEAPLRRTQQGTLYKRDRDRLEDDPVFAGTIADVIEPLPDMVALWLTLARRVGLLIDEADSDRIVAAPTDFWAENAIHLPQMIATRWLALRNWHEQGGIQQDGLDVELAISYVRPAILLWLSTSPGDAWVALDDLAVHLRNQTPDWDRLTFQVEIPVKAPPRPKGTRGRKEDSNGEEVAGTGLLEAVLLGAAYQFGLIRTAEEVPSGRRVVQLSPLGRYILALGPPPAPRPAFDHFLFVQPNFEMIAYRQGLTPHSIGQFSRFARWSQVGAALELKLTPDSVYRGLEGGMEPKQMLDLLAKHSPRPLPAGVSEALRTWAGRRERVTYYPSATLIEFASKAELDAAIAQWPDSTKVPPVAISDRLLLVEDESSIPFQRFRLAGSRDYRRAPEACLEVEPDGVTLSLDLGRSDLLVDAELVRFSDEQELGTSHGTPGNPRRRFLVSAESLARASENGLTPSLLSNWYLRRTGGEIPPAVRLLLFAADPRVAPLSTSRPLVLHVPTPAVLDGLVQHPGTRDYLGERLGPTSVVLPDETLPSFRRVLESLGLTLGDPSGPEILGGSAVPNSPPLPPPPTSSRRPKRS